jgi:Putative Ig domain/Divergent InlB B-repeat domain
MRGRRSIAGLIALWMLASACGNQDSPTQPGQTTEISAGGLNASGSGSGGTFTLQVTKNGTGSGTVTSSPSGISCGTTCSRSFSGGTTVTLTAVPAAGSAFAGWSGGSCTGTGSCSVQINNNMTVTAAFNTSAEPPPPPPPSSGTFTLTVTKVQDGGTGKVTSSPAGIDCGATCTASFASGTSITLFASPTTGRFASWAGGPCSASTNPSCTFTIGANTTATASFANKPLTFLESTLPDGNVGADYSVSINTTGGSGTEQHRFSLVAGSLPDGLQMQSFFGVQSTLIHGRPTRIQTSTFTVRVDDGAETATRTFTITINAAVTLAITLPGPTARSGTVGQFYFQNLFASGGRTPYNWSIMGGALPPGLRIIRASNGNRIEGTPTTRGTFTFNLTVRDQDGQQATQVTSITIN